MKVKKIINIEYLVQCQEHTQHLESVSDITTVFLEVEIET